MPLAAPVVAVVLTMLSSPSAAWAVCGGGGRLTFEGSAAIDAWRIAGSGGIDYDKGFFPPTHQARFKYEPVHRNNGWLRATAGWHAIERTFDTHKPLETLYVSPYLQASDNLASIYVTLIDAQTGAVIEDKEVRIGKFAYDMYDVFFARAGGLPQRLTLRFGFWAPNADAWLRVGSVDIRHFSSLDCDSSGGLAELW